MGHPLVNLDQDFGYISPVPNSVGGTIWEDVNADGTQDAEETNVFEGVTVALYADTNGDGILGPGDKLIGTTTTDSNGNYIFTGLPDGNYFVDVTDDANLLNGYWHSVGDQAEDADGQSKIDPYRINLSGGEHRTTVDFGYYLDPAALVHRVWVDFNSNGIQDPGEPGLPGVTVTLTITYPNGVVTTITTITDDDGYYSFENLLLDEDYNGIGTDEPTFTISVTPPLSYPSPSPTGEGNDRDVDSGLALGEIVWTVKGGYNNSYDFGFWYTPTSVLLSADVRYDPVIDAFVISWSSTNEIEIKIYNLYREAIGEERVFLKAFDVIPGTDFYEYEDRDYLPGVRHIYSLEVHDWENAISNTVNLEPVISYKHYIPAISR